MPHPPEKPPTEQLIDNLVGGDPDQRGTTSQGWTRRDTARREKFNQINKTKDDPDHQAGDQQPTDPRSPKNPNA